MFGTIGRGLIATILVLSAVPLLTTSFLIAGIATLYCGITDGDWCAELWTWNIARLRELWDQLVEFVRG